MHSVDAWLMAMVNKTHFLELDFQEMLGNVFFFFFPNVFLKIYIYTYTIYIIYIIYIYIHILNKVRPFHFENHYLLGKKTTSSKASFSIWVPKCWFGPIFVVHGCVSKVGTTDP